MPIHFALRLSNIHGLEPEESLTRHGRAEEIHLVQISRRVRQDLHFVDRSSPVARISRVNSGVSNCGKEQSPKEQPPERGLVEITMAEGARFCRRRKRAWSSGGLEER